MDRIRWGIIGPGIIAHKFAQDFQFSEHGKLVAVASRNAARSQDFANQYGIEKRYTGYEGMYNDPDIDAIYIATPHNFHLPQSTASLKAGKAVLCEKPLTENLDNTRDLIKLASDSGNYLMEGMWTWFLPAIRRAKQWYNDGRIGDIKHIKADFGYPSEYDPTTRAYNPDLAGGCLLDMGIYTIAITQLFMDEDPHRMDVVARKAPTGVDMDVNMLFEYKESLASLTSSFRVKLPNWAYVIGEQGTIAIPDFWRAKECYLYEGEKIIDHFQDNRQGTGFNFEMDAVCLDIQDGKIQSDVISHEVSQRMAEAMDQVMKKF